MTILMTLPLSMVAREIGEFERTLTTVANAYVRPAVEKYLIKLDKELRGAGIRGSLHIMLSSGGVASAKTASEFPVCIIESGPAAGTLAAAFYTRLTGEGSAITFDMGGATTKLSLIADGQVQTTTEFEVARTARFRKGSGIPLKIVSIELIEIGAGGGSIARVDKIGLLKVGPDSADAEPGPVCYGIRGTEQTVTDADLILGFLNPDYFLGGEIRLDKGKALYAIDEKVAKHQS